MVTSSYALLYIAYPIQVIGRNIRFLFVVVVGAYFSRIKKLNSNLKLGKHKIYIASIITIGVLLFNFAKEVLNSVCSLKKTKLISMIHSING